MQNEDILYKYFPSLSEKQKGQLAQLSPLYHEWNEKINVISRKDMDNLYIHHVLHSLGLARMVSFLPQANILDVGTGGGFPGIPLAILFPDTHFHLVDSIGKKINVVKAIATELGLNNVKAEQVRAEQLKGKYDFVVSRAVTELKEFYSWVYKKINPKSNHPLDNGLLCLKGGDLELELKSLNKPYALYNLSDYFSEPFFETKKVVHVPVHPR